MLEIPAGDSRLIELSANIAPASLSPVLAFTGSTVENLAAGEIKEVTLRMRLSKVKLVIPDYLNNRVVQLDDISGANWQVLDYVDMGF